MESSEKKNKLYRGIKIALVVFLAVVLANFAVESFHENESGNKAENTIAFTGHGEVSAIPDIASVNFTIRKEAKTVKEAQGAVAEIEKKALDLLKTNDIADKDIKTVNASFNPKYEYKYGGACPMGYCPPGNSVIVGYEAYESITIKIRNTDDVGKIIEELGTLGVTELTGPNFTVDNEDALKAQARKLAIDDAKAKAKVLAKDLGVHLGKITSFNEGNTSPVPMYDTAMLKSSGTEVSAPARAQLPTGENLITSDVTITYQIR